MQEKTELQDQEAHIEEPLVQDPITTPARRAGDEAALAKAVRGQKIISQHVTNNAAAHDIAQEKGGVAQEAWQGLLRERDSHPKGLQNALRLLRLDELITERAFITSVTRLMMCRCAGTSIRKAGAATRKSHLAVLHTSVPGASKRTWQLSTVSAPVQSVADKPAGAYHAAGRLWTNPSPPS